MNTDSLATSSTRRADSICDSYIQNGFGPDYNDTDPQPMFVYDLTGSHSSSSTRKANKIFIITRSHGTVSFQHLEGVGIATLAMTKQNKCPRLSKLHQKLLKWWPWLTLTYITTLLGFYIRPNRIKRLMTLTIFLICQFYTDMFFSSFFYFFIFFFKNFIQKTYTYTYTETELKINYTVTLSDIQTCT